MLESQKRGARARAGPSTPALRQEHAARTKASLNFVARGSAEGAAVGGVLGRAEGTAASAETRSQQREGDVHGPRRL